MIICPICEINKWKTAYYAHTCQLSGSGPGRRGPGWGARGWGTGVQRTQFGIFWDGGLVMSYPYNGRHHTPNVNKYTLVRDMNKITTTRKSWLGSETARSTGGQTQETQHGGQSDIHTRGKNDGERERKQKKTWHQTSFFCSLLVVNKSLKAWIKNNLP